MNSTRTRSSKSPSQVTVRHLPAPRPKLSETGAETFSRSLSVPSIPPARAVRSRTYTGQSRIQPGRSHAHTGRSSDKRPGHDRIRSRTTPGKAALPRLTRRAARSRLSCCVPGLWAEHRTSPGQRMDDSVQSIARTAKAPNVLRKERTNELGRSLTQLPPSRTSAPGGAVPRLQGSWAHESDAHAIQERPAVAG
jgi:hypothetical protein